MSHPWPFRTVSVGAVAAGALVAACSVGVAATVPAAVSGTTGWRVIPGAAITCTSAVARNDPLAALLDVAATGQKDAWAVGVCGADGGTHDAVGQTPTGFVEHWNGRQWSRVKVPSSQEYDVVAAVSAKNVWVASVAGDPWAAASSGVLDAMPGGANLIHWNGVKWSVAQQGIPRSAALYSLAAASGPSAWALAYTTAGNHPPTALLSWDGRRWQRATGPAGFVFATRPRSTSVDPIGGGFLAASPAAGVWIGGETTAATPVIAKRHGTGWTTVPVPISTTHGWIDTMTVSGHDVWVQVDQAADTADTNGKPVLERYDGRTWTVLSTSFAPVSTNWSVAEINAGQHYGGYLLCQFKLTSAQRASFYGFAWTCPPQSTAVTALAAVPGKPAIWAAGANNPGPSMRPRTALFGHL